ncbi:MAG: sigma-54 dependent transcriptional regulator [Alphaproteobacteria bacterium]|nr:sigma-54 dependent transcriptional regulator [Alphaproteobacteria bacterium]
MSMATILLVEDQSALARTYQGFLRNEPYRIEHVENGAAALQALENNPSALLLDLKLPDMNGLEILKAIRENGLTMPVIVVTAHGSMQTAIDAMRAGAADFLVKPFTAERLKVTLRNALEKQELTAVVRKYQEEIDRKTFRGFIGSSLKMQAVYRAIESAANSKATVFFTGESGTGKEIAARAVHDLSGRTGAFVPLNCGAIPHDLMESEIFGHVKGAFTGALAEREGAARQAHKGTFFLDEVCEMELQLQTKLLRFLQTGQFTKVGGGTLEDVDVRIVCATNRDPKAEVRAGRFREDLFYRLHVIPIHMPPLRERGHDIIEIANQLFRHFAEQEGRDFERLSESAETLLRRHRWPGNVRELQNVVRNVVVMNHAPVIEPDMLDGLTSATENPRSSSPELQSEHSAKTQSLDQLAGKIRPLAEIEREAIEHALELCDGDVRKAAVFLDIAPATIYRKLKTWGSQ